MSISLMYKVIRAEGEDVLEHVRCGAPWYTKTTLEKAFDEKFPLHLGMQDIRQLEALDKGDSGSRGTYATLIKAIEKYGLIQLDFD